MGLQMSELFFLIHDDPFAMVIGAYFCSHMADIDLLRGNKVGIPFANR